MPLQSYKTWLRSIYELNRPQQLKRRYRLSQRTHHKSKLARLRFLRRRYSFHWDRLPKATQGFLPSRYAFVTSQAIHFLTTNWSSLSAFWPLCAPHAPASLAETSLTTLESSSVNMLCT